ncbi:perforin-1-like [Poecilia reticulata]|uniref:perforin-1-like n=1 Tax=Poecilia reticulata TaxID=8081 RepID=UPI0004A2C452|nr:PREDICTED: perforin-1-like [Poecilia reticulata]
MLPDSTSALLLISVLLVHSSVLSCRIGTQTECDAAPFVPGHDLVGPGFDIVRQHRKADVIDVKTYLRPSKTCVVCNNPFQNHALQKLPTSVLDWSTSSQCSDDIHSGLYTSLTSLVGAYTSQDASDWTFGLDVLERPEFEKLDMGATRSKAYRFASKRSKEDRYTFSTHSVTCSHYDFMVSITPPLTLKFKKRLDLLPTHYNSSTKNEFRKLIDIYGTHYARQVNLGGRLRRLITLRSCLASMNGLKSNEIETCLSMGVAVGLGKMKISSVPDSCIGVLKNKDSATNFRSGLHQHFTEVSGGNGWLGKFSIFQNDSMGYMNWLKSLKEHPDVVSYSLRPLYRLMPNELQKAAVKAAIWQYLKDTGVKKPPEEPQCDDKTPNVASNCCPLHTSWGNLSVTIVQAWKLYGDVVGVTDSYAKLRYGPVQRRTKMIQSDDPQWNAEFNLGKVDTSHQLLIEVWDEDSSKSDDLLVQCVMYLMPGSYTFTCSSYLGHLLFKFTLTCDPYLTGEKCIVYKPSPLVTGD